MSIRLKTLRNMSGKRRPVYRVRRRGWDRPRVFDTDGSEALPDTWERWEEEYYSHWGYAMVGCTANADGWGRVGYVDQVKASVVLARLEKSLEPEEMTDYEGGRHRVIYAQMVQNARLCR